MGGKRYALNIGSSEVSAAHYGSPRVFSSAEASSNYMRNFFEREKFDESILVQDRDATTCYLKEKLEHFAAILVVGDLFVLSFCGHTDGITENSDLDNKENEDEGWALYDRVLFHFEIWQFLQHFRAGVRVVIIADSCFSGDLGVDFAPETDINTSWFETHKDIYNPILEKSGKPGQHAIPPSVVILSASAENQKIVSMGRKCRTVFSNAFEDAWERQKLPGHLFKHNLSSFFDDIVWYIHVELITFPDLKCKLDRLNTPATHKKRVTPQWHYNQGHKYTKLRTQKPPFKE